MLKVNSLDGYENVLDIYFVDCDGYIFSEQTGKALKPYDNGNGYMYVQLKLKGVRKWKNVHVAILVAKAFVPNPLNLPEINHKDENKTNNRADNLEWMTHKENNNYGTKNQRMIRTRCRNGRMENFFYLDRPIEDFGKGNFLEIVNSSRYRTVVVENIVTGEKKYFCTNRDSRRFF